MLDTLGERFRGSVMMKLLIVFGLVLVLQVLVHRIENLVGEREGHRAIAESEVQRSWGGVQCVEGPLLLAAAVNCTFVADENCTLGTL